MSKRIRNPFPKLVIPNTPAALAPSPDLEAMAAQAKVARAAACQAEINVALKRHNCRIDVVQIWVNGQQRDMQINLVALDAQPQPPAPNGKVQP